MSEGLKELLNEDDIADLRIAVDQCEADAVDGDDEGHVERLRALVERLADAVSAQQPGREQLEKIAKGIALREAQSLALHLAKRCYPEVPDFKVLDSIVGVLSQIDNMTTGLVRAPPAPQPSADIERLERIAAGNEALAKRMQARAGESCGMADCSNACDGGYSFTSCPNAYAARKRYLDQAAEALANAAAIRSAISSQISPQGKQGVRTELARLGSQEATPNTGVKLERGGG